MKKWFMMLLFGSVLMGANASGSPTRLVIESPCGISMAELVTLASVDVKLEGLSQDRKVFLENINSGFRLEAYAENNQAHFPSVGPGTWKLWSPATAHIFEVTIHPVQEAAIVGATHGPIIGSIGLISGATTAWSIAAHSQNSKPLSPSR